MPRFPRLADRTTRVEGSTFEAFLPRLRRHEGGFHKLHIGDADRGPEYRLDYREGFAEEHPYAFQYANTWGVGRLREAIAEKLREENDLPARREDVLVTAGATNALSAAVQSLVEEGDEVLVLTPAWPFFRGMVPIAGGSVRELPFYPRLRDGSSVDVQAEVERAVTPRTVALYLNSPNNPSGVALTREEIEGVLEVARRHDLWVISDEAYDGMLYDDRWGFCPRAVEATARQTLSVFTFSKTYRFAGLRLGWATGPSELLGAMNRMMVHQIYGPTVPGQYMMVEALRTRSEWAPRLRREYQGRRDRFLEALDLDVPVPEGTYFVFFDVADRLGSGGIEELVGRCVDAGIAVSPGADFGRDFTTWLRLCFIAEEESRANEGARRLRSLL